MSKVTVVIPCYNNFETIAKTYNSVLDQTFKDYNIIIVNDGSNEETTALVNSFENEDLILINQKNQGVVTARNNGIEVAKSKYILTLDGDDFFEPSFLKRSVDFLEANPKCGVVSCNYNVINEDGLSNVSKLKDYPTLNDLLIKNRLPANALYRRVCWEQTKGYDIVFNDGFEDWDYWINVASKGWRIKIFKEPLLNVFIKKKSRNRVAMRNDIALRRLVFNKYQDLYKDNIVDFTNVLFDDLEILKRTVRKRDLSMDMKIGRVLLKPFRKIKQYFKY